jgi:hypothetical protein
MCSIIRGITSCSQLKLNRRFGGIFCLHLAELATWFILVTCLAYSSNLQMKATCSSETSVDLQRTTRRYFLEDRTSHERVHFLW